MCVDVAPIVGFFDTSYLGIAFCNGLCHFRSHEISGCVCIVRGRISVFLVFCTGKEEELIFDDRTSESGSESLRYFVLILVFFVVSLIPSAIQILVCIVSISRSLKLVGSRLGNCIDGTSCKTTLPDVEWRGNHLNLLDGIQRNGVGTGLSAVGSTLSQTENIVAHHAIDLKRIVAIVGSGDGDATFFAHVHQWRELGNVVNVAVDSRCVVYLGLREVGRSPHTAGTSLARDGHFAQKSRVFF